MATWKKLATVNNQGQINGSITGVAHGGLAETLSVSGGGTGTDLSDFATNSLLCYNGSQVTAIPPGSTNQILTTEGGSWTWKDVKDMHSHDSEYLSLATGGTIQGSLAVTGAVYADDVQAVELQTITQADGMSVILNAGGSSTTGDEAGVFCNNGGGAGTTVQADDPAILWDNDTSRWKMGKYAANGSTMHDISMVMLGETPTNGGSTTHAGVFATDNDGNIFFSV